LEIHGCTGLGLWRKTLLKLGILTIPGSVVEHLAQCRTLGDLPVEMLPPSQLKKLKSKIKNRCCLCLASVVPSQTAVWQTYPDVHVITLVPPVFIHTGIDRALAVWGAGETWGWPMLVIDGNSADFNGCRC